MNTKVFSATTIGITTYAVEVEVDLSFGLLQFFIVGLPDIAIKESRQRIQTALKNCGIKLPERKITVNLAPAHLKKEGTVFDLPIALGILQAAHIVHMQDQFLHETLFLGELSLDGTVKPVKGVLPIAYDALNMGKKRLIVAYSNAQEAALIQDIEVIGISHLTELIAYIRNEKVLIPTKTQFSYYKKLSTQSTLDFSQVKGQSTAKRALQIAAAGRHNILFIGSPGSGKTMLAKRLPTIMPEMSFDEIVETSKVYSISGKLDKEPLITERPFRSPHHTISQAGLVGGGSFPQPGEISLAHNGILFLDELTEFKRTVLEALRQPLEQESISISRAHHTINYPASFLLIAALNPCPCGFFNDKKRTCICTEQQISTYIRKLSGPLLDRIDLQIPISSVDYDTIVDTYTPTLTSQELRNEVMKAISFQRGRYKKQEMTNASLTPDLIAQHCLLTDNASAMVKKAFEKLHLTMRGYHKLLKVARTIADFEQSAFIDTQHIKEAMFYRSLDATLAQTNL